MRTPWGDSTELRERMMVSGPRASPEEAAQNQRERLFAALVATSAERGFEACTVSDLVALSGVSRRDFYKHFANKGDCLLAAVEALIDPTIATIAKAQIPAGEERAREVFETFIKLVVYQEAASRLCFVELYAAGPEAERAIERGFEAFEALLREVNEQLPGRAGIPAPMLRAIMGGLRKIIHTRLYRRQAEDLLELAPGLWQWGLSYYPPPIPLRSGRRRRPERPQFDGYTSAQRIARAAAAVIAERGYTAMSSDDVAKRASVSLSTFYEHFANKEEATLAAIGLAGALLHATVDPALRAAADWQSGVVVGYEAICAFLAAEPDFATLGMIEVYAAGPRALAERDRILESLQRQLAPAFAEHPETPAITAEAITASAYSLLADQLRRDGAASLPAAAPLATYLTLTPFTGPERACELANAAG